MIAIAVGAIFVVGTSMIIASSLGESAQAGKVQVAAANAGSLLNNVRVWSEGSWNNVLSLATGSSYQYYLITSSTPYTATSGIESLVTESTTYTRYFYLSDVYRSGGYIAPSGAYDPSTKQVSIVYGWTGGKTNTISTYLTRNNDATLSQTDWSGGSNNGFVVTSTNSQFGTSSNIDYTTTTGSLYVPIPGY